MEQQKLSKGKKALAIVLAVILVIGVVANVLIQYYSFTLRQVLGDGEIRYTHLSGTENWDSEYYTTDYATYEETEAAARALTEEIESEGIVLLENKDNALPLSSLNVTLLGVNSVNIVTGGTGSGSGSGSDNISLVEALENNGFTVNPTTLALYTSETVTDASYEMGVMNEGMFGPTETKDFPKYQRTTAGLYADNNPWIIGELPVAFYDASVEASFSDYSDAAIVVFSRVSGEGADMATDMGKFADWGGEEGKHYLEFDSTEQALLRYASDHFDTVIVLINSNNAMELGSLADGTYENVKGVLWIGAVGSTGANAVAKVIKGDVNPSGRLADIYARDFTADPTFVNFGNYQYSNVSSDNAMADSFFVQYEEGIYVGYRYYETAAAEGFIDYDEAVVYPFGYGLSYSSFTQEFDGTPSVSDGAITFKVKVTNTGDTAGKEVVQLYYHAPYGDETTNPNKLEKAERVLAAFAKTELLDPGKSQTLTLTVNIEDMASYDETVEKAYVLDDGDYVISLMKNSHEPWGDSYTYHQDRQVVYGQDNPRSSDAAAATNRFEDVSTELKSVMSRADFAGTFPTAPQGDDYKASDAVIANLAEYNYADHDDPSDVMPTTGSKNGLSLIDMRGVDYDDESWTDFVEQLSVSELAAYVNGVGSTAIESLGIPVTSGIDGPASLNSMYDVLGTQSNNTYTTEVVLASTWNVELAERMGNLIGNEALFLGVSGWYAPGANTHRSPFGGRNFEYMSEDPRLAGNMLRAEISGVAEKGVYAYIKHFAMNDQETNRNNYGGICVWATEQAIREIYLKGFEIPVKEATATLKYIADSEGTAATKTVRGCTAVMSAFSRIGATWTGGSIALLQNVLRDEWGFEGVVVTDAIDGNFMNGDQAVRNGSDLLMSSMLPGSARASYGGSRTVNTDSATAVKELQEAVHNILFAVVNSNAMNGIVPGTSISYSTPTWLVAVYAVDAVLLLAIIAGYIWIFRKPRKSTV